MTSEATTKIIEWLKVRKPEIDEIHLDQDLMATGVLDSLQFVNFMMFIEQLRGESIDQDDVVPENFQSLNSIQNVFFQ